MTDGLVFDERYHRYFLDGVRVPSVTGIKDVINKPFLLKWYGDNGTAEARRLSKEAADFGTRVHKGCEAVALGQVSNGYAIEEAQCIQSYAAWFFRHVRRVIAVEVPVASRRHQMAGTPDLVAVLDGEVEVRRPSGLIELVDMSGETAVLDVKTSSSVGDDFALQLEGYRRMLMEWLGIEPTRRLVVHMPRKTPGRLEIVEFPMKTALDDWRAFLSALVIWHRLFKTKAFAEPAVGKFARSGPAARAQAGGGARMTIHEPCRCDPPESGEEHCNGGCILRAQLSAAEARAERLAAALEPAEAWMAHVLEMLDWDGPLSGRIPDADTRQDGRAIRELADAALGLAAGEE